MTGNANSNGKSVSWSESGPRHPPKGGSVWHRLSVHVRKQEANQTAVIRPLTNTPDPHSCDPPAADQGTGTHPAEDPPGGAQKPPMHDEDSNEDAAHRPFWTPTCSGHMRDSHSGCPPAQGLVDTHISHVPSLSDRPAIESTNEPLSLTPSRLPAEENRDLLHSYVCKGQQQDEHEEDPGEEDGLLPHKAALEDPLALSPPSPFRDSVCSGESGSGSPSSSIYTADILRDFAHSSSTL